MVFSTPFFLFTYFPLVLAIHAITPLKWRNAVLLVVNLIFYGWKKPAYILIMFASIGIDYVHGLLVEKAKGAGNDKRAKRYVIQSIAFTAWASPLCLCWGWSCPSASPSTPSRP